MTSEIPTQLQAVQRASRSLRRFFMVLFGGTLLGSLALLFGQRTITLAGIAFAGDAVTGKIQTLWVIESVLTAAVLLKGLFHLIRLFGLYADGKIFTRENVRQIRQLGITLLLMPAVWLLVVLAAVPELTNVPDVLVRLVPSFPGMALIGGAIVLLVAWIMDVGRELREEQDLVI